MPTPTPSTFPYYQFLRPGFPQEMKGPSGVSYVLEYVGPAVDLPTPDAGELWPVAPWRVEDASSSPASQSGNVVLRVTVTSSTDSSSGVLFGTRSEVAYERDTADIARPMHEHPDFQTGGTYPLTTTDRVEIELWRAETAGSVAKKTFQFRERDANGMPTGAVKTLSTNAQKYALFVLLNGEQFNDSVPVMRRTSVYRGGPPNSVPQTGVKENLPSDIPNPPQGLEWLRTTDRSIRAAGQRTWQHNEEWHGFVKILVDRNKIYI